MADVYFTHICSDGRIIRFVWDQNKDEINREKHRIEFSEAVEAFCDPDRITRYDWRHSSRGESRYFCLGKVEDGPVLTVRFTRRDEYIRIIGAGFWREGKAEYDNRYRP